ncbi:MAG: shikimate kinase [Arenimonas sp.]
MIAAPNLVLVGPMGAGKSSIGRRLAGRLGLQFVDADRAIEEATGASVPMIFELEGEAGFRVREQALIAELCAGRDQLIATGGGAVLDEANRDVLHQRGFVVYLRLGIEQQLRRLARDTARPLLAGPDRRERLQQLAAQREPLYSAIADLTFDCDRLPLAEAVNRLATALAPRWHPEVAA